MHQFACKILFVNIIRVIKIVKLNQNWLSWRFLISIRQAKHIYSQGPVFGHILLDSRSIGNYISLQKGGEILCCSLGGLRNNPEYSIGVDMEDSEIKNLGLSPISVSD